MKKIFICTVTALFMGFAVNTHAVEVDILGGVEIHGFISQGFLKSTDYNYLTNDSEDGSFAYNELGINFSKNLTDKLRVGIQFYSRDLGDVSNNKITVDWAYGDYRWKDWLGIRAGRIKMPLGLFTETRDLDMLRTCIILPQITIYNELLRESTASMDGVGLYGNTPIFKDLGSLDYQAVVGIVSIDVDSGTGKFLSDTFSSQLGGIPVTTDKTESDTTFAASLQWNTPLEGLAIKTSGVWFSLEHDLTVSPPAPAPAYSLTLKQSAAKFFVFSAQYTWENLTTVFEFLRTENVLEIPQFGVRSPSVDREFYVMANYRFTDWFEAGVYRMKNKNTGDNDNALSLRFDLNEYSVFKLEGHYVEGNQMVLAVDNPGIESDSTDKTWYYGAAKVTFFF
jgi:hypothetical protein